MCKIKSYCVFEPCSYVEVSVTEVAGARAAPNTTTPVERYQNDKVISRRGNSRTGRTLTASSCWI